MSLSATLTEQLPAIPAGNHEPSELASFLYNDFAVAWNAMATASPDPHVGGNLMFARQALAYLELASRTASSDETKAYLDRFADRLADCDGRYFTPLPAVVPLPRADDFLLPASPSHPANLQLLAGLFDSTRHGLAHLSQQTPVHLTDGKIWMVSFTGVQPGRLMTETPSTSDRKGHLAYRVSPHGHVYLVVLPDILLADVRFAARLAAIFSQYLAPEYLQRPRPSGPRKRGGSAAPPPYQFSSAQLIASLELGGHERLPWPVN